MPAFKVEVGHQLTDKLFLKDVKGSTGEAENLFFYVPVDSELELASIGPGDIAGFICKEALRDSKYSLLSPNSELCPVSIGDYKRRHIVSSFGGQYWQISGRGLKDVSVVHAVKPPDVTCTYAPNIIRGDHFFSISDGVKHLFNLLPGDIESKPGLIAICGQTGAAKSQYAEGIIAAYFDQFFRAGIKGVAPKLWQPVDSATKPYHLLTLEQPIEKSFFELDDKPLDPRFYGAYGLFYTPRDLLRDFTDSRNDVRNAEMYHGELTPLKIGLQLDALRQKPTLTYVGECRAESDLAEVLQFAETGHTVITTFHAGSLIEGMRRLLRAGEAKTPFDRSDIGSRIVMLAHLATASVPNSGKQACLPSVWKGTAESVASLTKDGLASLVPNKTDIFGRANIGASLIDQGLENEAEAGSDLPQWKERILELARNMDLQAEGHDNKTGK